MVTNDITVGRIGGQPRDSCAGSARRGRGSVHEPAGRAKGHIANFGPAVMDGTGLMGADHHLWEVGASFPTIRSDLRARPVFHHERDAIEAHLTVASLPKQLAVTCKAAKGSASRTHADSLRRTLGIVESSPRPRPRTHRPSRRHPQPAPKGSLTE